jgi:helicase MOV-10
MHEAMNTAYFERRTLFPGPEEVKYLRAPTVTQVVQIKTIDRSIMKNFPQMEAVTAIVNRPKGSAPFVVFGPYVQIFHITESEPNDLRALHRPGTGKTITIVEAIRQLLISNPEYRILACAPSNSAADLIAVRLVALGRDQLFRLNAYTRLKKDILPSLLPFSYLEKDSFLEDDKFAIPPKETLMKYRVIVSTCFSASTPSGLGVPRGHFTHIFLDEAGQSTEPESMVSIKTMADTETNIILSGDIKQLGPIVHSWTARHLGLATSYLGRLMANPLYDERKGHGTTLVIKFTTAHSLHLTLSHQCRQAHQELSVSSVYLEVSK